jgi:hypothetical protein
MGMSRVTYNDYVFPDRSNFHIVESFVYDPSDRTVIATRFSLRLQTIIVNEAATGPLDSFSFAAKDYVHYARQRISKAGARLIIEHDGFGPTLDINGGGVKDVAWGPKPRVIDWNPVGHTNSVEVTWEVEWQIPICDGSSPPNFTGLSSFSYGVSFDIDERGYTTRTISGNIQIALSRQNGGRNLVDSVDNYRNKVNFAKPTNFQRRTSWQVSEDKRTANFTIVDSEIASPNAWPAGVVSINATHRASWQRTSVRRVMNTISATIEMSPDEHKARSWMIFRGLVEKRIVYAKAGEPKAIFIEAIDVIEDIFENRVSFQLTYRVIGSGEEVGATAILTQGLFQPVSDEIDSWQAWDDSVKALQPFRGLNTDRGNAGLRHEWQNERLVDLCNQSPPETSNYPKPLTPPRALTPVLCNERPAPNRSWLSFEATLTYYENGIDHTAVEIKANDLEHKEYNANSPDAGYATVSQEKAERFTEDQAGVQEFVWTGKAERVGYPIRKPGQLRIGNKTYRPIGKGIFSQAYLGLYFCQPKYAAAWKQRYRLVEPVTTVETKDVNGGVE